MEELEMQFDFTKRKPVKCVHCKLAQGEHRAKTYQCPAKWSRGRAVGYTSFLETVFTPAPPQGARMSEIELPEPAYHYVAETRRAYSNEVVEAFAGSSPLYTAEQARQLIAAERERCASIAERGGDGIRSPIAAPIAKKIAEDIRKG